MPNLNDYKLVGSNMDLLASWQQWNGSAWVAAGAVPAVGATVPYADVSPTTGTLLGTWPNANPMPILGGVFRGYAASSQPIEGGVFHGTLSFYGTSLTAVMYGTCWPWNGLLAGNPVCYGPADLYNTVMVGTFHGPTSLDTGARLRGGSNLLFTGPVTFPLDSMFSVNSGVVFRDRVKIGGTWFYAKESPLVALPRQVRRGVSNAGSTGQMRRPVRMLIG